VNRKTAHLTVWIEVVVDSDLLARSAPMTGHIDYFELTLTRDATYKLSEFRIHSHFTQGIERRSDVRSLCIDQRVLVLFVEVCSCQPPWQSFYIMRERVSEACLKDLRYEEMTVRLGPVETVTYHSRVVGRLQASCEHITK
jgi:hypothetical protein